MTLTYWTVVWFLWAENSAFVPSHRLLQEAFSGLFSSADCSWHVHAQCAVRRHCHCWSVIPILSLLWNCVAPVFRSGYECNQLCRSF